MDILINIRINEVLLQLLSSYIILLIFHVRFRSIHVCESFYFIPISTASPDIN